MEVFLGTFIIVTTCCIAMGVGLILSGKPLTGGCGSQIPKASGCMACPSRGKKKTCQGHPETSGKTRRKQC